MHKQRNENFVEFYGKVESALQPPPPVISRSYTNDFLFTPVGRQGLANSTCPPDHPFPRENLPLGINLNNNNPQLINTEQSTLWRDRNIPIQETFGVNQQLAGPPNPRTLIQPVIPSPIYDVETWQPNDFIIPMGINDQKRQELYQNGYITTPPVLDYQQPPQQLRTTTTPLEDLQVFPNHSSHPRHAGHSGKLEVREEYNPGFTPEYSNYEVPPNDSQYNQTNYNIKSREYNGYVNSECGYRPKNLEYGLPVNYNSSACQRTPGMKEYNENLFSIPLQPGIYTNSQVNQPYASMYNLGISMDQQFLPTTATVQPDGNLQFTEHDPKTFTPCNRNTNISCDQQPLRNEIYDPRLTGYGTSYRSYLEPMTGQTRFYYDDIDQQTQPNYITRNNLDVYGFASEVGAPNQQTLQGDKLRAFANNNYTASQLQYRTELQQRLMLKNSNREWQKRIAPISTFNQTGGGGGGGTMSSFYK